jgi:molybdopterin-guanine dinucleotide biosynthesis protein A
MSDRKQVLSGVGLMGFRMSNEVVPLSAAILAGGKSSRMGMDKALVRLAPDDPPLLGLVRDRLQEVADDIFLVAEPRLDYTRLVSRVVPDDEPGNGPLGGIATAIRHARHEHCLVVSCDLPFLNPRLISWMASLPRDYDVLIPRLPGESRQGGTWTYETLHAIYGRACLPAIGHQLAEGKRQIVGFFGAVTVQPIDEPELRRFDPELRSFYNTNTPEALARARRWRAETQERFGLYSKQDRGVQ